MSGGSHDPWADYIMIKYDGKNPLVRTPKSYTDAVKVTNSLYPSLKDSRIRFMTDPIPRFGNLSAEITQDLYSDMVKHDALMVLNVSIIDAPRSKARIASPVPSASPNVRAKPRLSEPGPSRTGNRHRQIDQSRASTPESPSAADRGKSDRARNQHGKNALASVKGHRGMMRLTFLTMRLPITAPWQTIDAAICTEQEPGVSVQSLKEATELFLRSARNVTLPLSGAFEQRKSYTTLVERFKAHIKSHRQLKCVLEKLKQLKARPQNHNGMAVLDLDASLFFILYDVSKKLVVKGRRYGHHPASHKPLDEEESEVIDLTLDSGDSVSGDDNFNAKIKMEEDSA